MVQHRGSGWMRGSMEATQVPACRPRGGLSSAPVHAGMEADTQTPLPTQRPTVARASALGSGGGMDASPATS